MYYLIDVNFKVTEVSSRAVPWGKIRDSYNYKKQPMQSTFLIPEDRQLRTQFKIQYLPYITVLDRTTITGL